MMKKYVTCCLFLLATFISELSAQYTYYYQWQFARTMINPANCGKDNDVYLNNGSSINRDKYIPYNTYNALEIYSKKLRLGMFINNELTEFNDPNENTYKRYLSLGVVRSIKLKDSTYLNVGIKGTRREARALLYKYEYGVFYTKQYHPITYEYSAGVSLRTQRVDFGISITKNHLDEIGKYTLSMNNIFSDVVNEDYLYNFNLFFVMRPIKLAKNPNWKVTTGVYAAKYFGHIDASLNTILSYKYAQLFIMNSIWNNHALGLGMKTKYFSFCYSRTYAYKRPTYFNSFENTVNLSFYIKNINQKNDQ